MSLTITYVVHHPWGPRTGQRGGTSNRPYAEVLVGPKRLRVWCLVDTGADELMLDTAAVARAGISCAGAPHVTVATAGGSLTVQRVAGQPVEIEGVSITTDILFAPRAIPLLGRNALLSAVRAGFDHLGWLHT